MPERRFSLSGKAGNPDSPEAPEIEVRHQPPALPARFHAALQQAAALHPIEVTVEAGLQPDRGWRASLAVDGGWPRLNRSRPRSSSSAKSSITLTGLSCAMRSTRRSGNTVPCRGLHLRVNNSLIVAPGCVAVISSSSAFSHRPGTCKHMTRLQNSCITRLPIRDDISANGMV